MTHLLSVFTSFLLLFSALTSNAQPLTDTAHFAKLLARAHSDETVSVIVELGSTGKSPENRHRSLMQKQASLVHALAPHRHKIRHRYEAIPFVSLEVSAAGLEALKASGAVTDIAEDIILFQTLTKSTQQIGAPAVWQTGNLGAGQAVAVIDSGVYASHPFFQDRVIDEYCFSSNNTRANAMSLCPNTKTRMIGAGAAAPMLCLATDGIDCSHGTHVAGIIGGASTTRRGVAPAVDIIAMQTFTFFEGEEQCDEDDYCIGALNSDLLAALDKVYQLRNTYSIAAVNMSLGAGAHFTPCDSSYKAMTSIIKKLKKAGIATIAASGNEYLSLSTIYPACISEAIAVGSVDARDEASDFSNKAAWVRLYAPGESISSAYQTNQYRRMSGTSMATPHVASAYALVKSLAPELSIDEITDLLFVSGAPVSGLAEEEGKRIDLANLLDAL